jgi:hypothetical protein
MLSPIGNGVSLEAFTYVFIHEYACTLQGAETRKRLLSTALLPCNSALVRGVMQKGLP